MGSAPDEARVRSTLGSYRLLGQLGLDPLGGLYLACPAGAATFPRWAVIRRMHAGVARDPGMVHAFIAATQTALRIVHRNVATTFDFGGKMALPWSAREHLYGATVVDVIGRLVAQRSGVPWAVAGHLVAEAAEGVAAIRARLPTYGPPVGFLTGAVAPSVFVTRTGEVKIVDGCLPLIDGLPLIDSQSLPYRPREPVAVGPGAGRSDAFGLGVILWELVAGRRLFAGQDDEETARLLDAGVIPSLQTVARVPAVLDEIVQRAVGRTPAGTTASPLVTAADVARALRDALTAHRASAGADHLARIVGDSFASALAEEEARVHHAWARERELQASGDVPPDLTSEDELTLRGDETVRDATTETAISVRGGMGIPEGFDDVPTMPRLTLDGVVTWRPQTSLRSPLRSPLQVPNPRIDYLPDESPPPPRPVAPPFGSAEGADDASVVVTPLSVPAIRLPPVEALGAVHLADPQPATVRSPGARESALPDLELLPPVARRRSALLVAGALGFAVSVFGFGVVVFGIYQGDAPVAVAPGASASSGASYAPRAAASQPPHRPSSPWATVPSARVPVSSPDDLPRASGRIPAALPPTSRPPSSPFQPVAPSGRTGLLTVFCTPACDEVFDGTRALGPSPVFKAPTSAGVHRIRLRVDGRSLEKTVTVTVPENDTVVVRETLGG